MRLPASGGAAETLLELQRDVAKRQVRVEQLRNRYDNAIALESQQGELRLERQRLAAILTRDLAERQQVLRPAFVIFERLSQRLYADQQHGRLVVNATDNGPEITATIPRGRSKGITNMQVYCFDLDLITLWSANNAARASSSTTATCSTASTNANAPQLSSWAPSTRLLKASSTSSPSTAMKPRTRCPTVALLRTSSFPNVSPTTVRMAAFSASGSDRRHRR
ncbi:uncharacterized protein DUF2326 [Actinocrispum wychmicini]|uniref:Uncharacterized protein DUF2326 n=1 Tax=Actinocrispum wychmicini TaxID=1213861 RepID=A0A4R2JF38_9PSEU|nr:DUF2326 domain-containing protein [Actinocrispum wychmicini]TCO58333.1 uncharacterized protein DUF2326 [Actinocrispum wychmicini]